MRTHRAAALIILLRLVTALPALAEQRMVSVGDRRIAVYCDGEATRLPSVILVPAGGRTAKDWETIQPEVARFTRVCSYDHANFGQSDRALVRLQSVDEVVGDLRAWLRASDEKGPFVLVSHSNSGIYVRRFETLYMREVAGLVFLDSAHEEHGLRWHELDPAGPAPDEVMASVGWYVKPGQRLDWQTKVPLIVIGRGTPFERRARDGSNSPTNRMTEDRRTVADRMIARLSDLLRLTLENIGVQEVRLAQELEFLERYLEIERMRFPDRLQVWMRIAPETLDARAPYLILQPIVENAVRHGIAPRSTLGTVEIRSDRKNDRLVLEIRDDGPGVSPESNLKDGVGISSTRARLEKLYGAAHQFELRNAAEGGLVVTLTMAFRLTTVDSGAQSGSGGGFS